MVDCVHQAGRAANRDVACPQQHGHVPMTLLENTLTIIRGMLNGGYFRKTSINTDTSLVEVIQSKART